jgi:hypothetical protein
MNTPNWWMVYNVLQSAQNTGNIMSSEKEQMADMLGMVIEISQDLNKINQVVNSDAIAIQIMQVDAKIMELSDKLFPPDPSGSLAGFTPLVGNCEFINYISDLIFRACF